MKIGVLALQGDFAEHVRILEHIGVTAVEVRLPRDLADIDGLIIPGGESTTIGKLAVRNASSEDVRREAIDQGMRTLRQDGWLKVAQGLTTIGEVLRVIA